MTPTCRTYPRSLREAFPADWVENCFGIERPIPTRPGLIDRIRRFFRR